MAARGARNTKQRVTVMRETTLGTADTATAKHMSGLTGVAYDYLREMFEDQSESTDRHSQLAPWLGEKKNTLKYQLPLHKNLIVNAADIFESNFGGVRGATDITTPGGYTTTTFTFGGGTPHDWVVFNDASNRKAYRPVVRNVAGTASLAYALPTGYTPTSVKNPNQFGAATGKCYYEDPNAAFLSLQAQLDRPGEPDKVDYVLKGMVAQLMFSMAINGRRMLDVSFQGTDWSQATGAQLADPTDPTKMAAGWQVECYILSDFDAPGADPAKTPILGYSVNWGPEWMALPGSIGRAGSNEDAIPASPVIEWRRGRKLGGGTLEILTAFASSSWQTAMDAETDFHIGIVDYLGNPAGSFSGDAFCHYYPKCRIVEVKTEPQGNIDVNRIKFHFIDERDVGNSAGQISSGLIKKVTAAQFIS